LGCRLMANYTPHFSSVADRGEFLALCQGQGWGGAGVYSDLDGPDEYFRLFRAMITGEVCVSPCRAKHCALPADLL
jgi:hypothetical protein